jgi:hypothetical protein
VGSRKVNIPKFDLEKVTPLLDNDVSDLALLSSPLDVGKVHR